MRELQVLGLAEDGPDSARLVCEDPSNGERFALPADERLRAAARGDVSRLGQLEIEMESQLRPAEIQSRIRSGATVEQVAAAAGTTVAKIERFAYPVLLERVTVAERAQAAHPISAGVPGRRRIADVVADTLTERGQAGAITWDAFRDDSGWVLALRWRAGRSENRATWSYHPGPDGGTLNPRDDTAAELVDPAPRSLRTVRAAASQDDPPTQEIPRIPADPPPPGGRTESEPDPIVEQTVSDERSGVHPASASDRSRDQQARAARTGTESARPAKRGSRPAMPSWEDVLLGSGAKRR